MKFKYFCSTLFLLIFLSCNLAKANNSFAYLDIDYLMKNSNAIKELNIKLNNIKKDNQDIFIIEERKISKAKEKLLKKRNVLSPEEFKKETKIFQEKIKKNNYLKKDKIEILNAKKIKAEKIFSSKLKNILNDYSKTNSISLIFRKDILLNGLDDLDITADIVKIFNNKVKKIEIK